MTWKVYMLQCADNSLYTGITTDIERRLKEHNSDNNKGARYTRVRRPVSLAYLEDCDDRADASKREYQLKRLPRSEKLKLVTTTTQT
ncbi:MAG: putative endonuclease [Arenicella sp.]|jgi:putative endonuclease